MSSFSSVSNVPRSDAVYDGLPEPIFSLLPRFMTGETEFGAKPPFEYEYALAATALNPGTLKHGKVVDISLLHISLANAHVSVLQAAATQRDFR